MKRKSILVVACLLASILLVSTTTYAKYKTDIEGSAYGTFENYVGEPSLSAEVVSGIWNLKVIDGQVWFYTSVLEKNIIPGAEGSPEGSVDILEYSIAGKPFAISQYYCDTVESTCVEVFANMHIKKQWAQWDGTYTTKSWTGWGSINILPNGVAYTVNDPYDSSWWKLGTVAYQDFAPEVTSLSIDYSTDTSTWYSVTGSLFSGFELEIDTSTNYYYLDANSIDFKWATPIDPLATWEPEDGMYPFYLDNFNVPTGFYEYWALKGIDKSATGDWEPYMWEIINGELPMLYLMKDGTDYMLVDGLMYAAFDMIEPLKVNGDYPTGAYTFHGDGQVFLVNNIQIEFSNPP